MISNTLTLKEFIEVTLSDVCDAVDSAREKYSYIAPKIYTDPTGADKATIIDFDLAVTVSDTDSLTDSKSGDVGGGLRISVLRAETKISAEDEKYKSSNTSKESRVKFSVPIYFQFDEVGREKRLRDQEESRRKIEEHNNRSRNRNGGW